MHRLLIAFVYASLGSALLVLPALSQEQPSIAPADQVAKEYEWMLRDEGIRSRIIGIDEQGVPMLCGTQLQNSRLGTNYKTRQNQESGSEEKQWIAWEVVPNVVPVDGSQDFYVKAVVNHSNIKELYLDLRLDRKSFIVEPNGVSRKKVVLRDNGENNDEVKGDSVYTSQSLSIDTTDSNLRGQFYERKGGSWKNRIFGEGVRSYIKKEGEKAEQGDRFDIVIMDKGIHDPGNIKSADSMQVSNHVVNVKENFSVQKRLRNIDTEPKMGTTTASGGAL